MGKLSVTPLPIAGAFEVVSETFRDARGAFSRLYCAEELAQVLSGRSIVQVNMSRTAQVGAVRGMHYQMAPVAEMKFVRCMRGAVWDVVVDLRAGSATFLQWHAVELRPERANMLVVPEGCAHGFQVLEPDSELLYLHTAFYTPAHEGGVKFDDPKVAIAWPLPVKDVSARDAGHPLLGENYEGLTL